MLNANPTPLTPPRVPIIDARTGLIDRSWYMFFLSLFNTAEDMTGQISIDTNASLNAELNTLRQEFLSQPSIPSDYDSFAIWYSAQGIGAVTRTVQSKLRETLSVKDFGAIGDGIADDTAAIQRCIDAITDLPFGGVAYLPAGQYKVTSNITITWPNLVVLQGAGQWLVNILDYRADVTTNGCITYDAQAAAGGINGYMFTWTGGFTLTKSVNYTQASGGVITVVGTGKGLFINTVVGGVFRDIAVRGYEYNIYAIDCLGNVFRDIYSNFTNYGLYFRGVYYFSPPNAVTAENVVTSGCGVWGIYINGGMVQVTGGTCSDCGTMATTSGGICIVDDFNTPLPQTSTVNNVWFERNRGQADVYVTNTVGSVVPFSIKIENNFFSRLDSTLYTLHNIYVAALANTTIKIESDTNGFRGYGSYVASAARKYIAAGGAYAAQIEYALLNDTYTDPIESPQIADGGSEYTSLGIVNKLSFSGNTGYQAFIQNDTGNWLNLNGVAQVVPLGGIGPVASDSYWLGATTNRWQGTFTKYLDISNTITWGAYVIPIPTGSTTTYLRNDGTWAVPAGTTTPNLAAVTAVGAATNTAIVFNLTGTSTAYIGNSTGSWLSLSGVAEVVQAGGIGPVSTNTYWLGNNTNRWYSTSTNLIDVSGTITWGAYTIAVPTGSTTTYLRNDGTWGAISTDYTYTATATGMTTSPTVTVKYTRMGSVVTMDITAIAGTSNATTFTLTGGTTAMRPAAQKQVIAGVADNGVLKTGLLIVETSGTLSLYIDFAGGAFTNSGAKGLVGLSFSYTVA